MKNNNTIIDRLDTFMKYKNLNDNKITNMAKLSIGLLGRARKNKKGLHTDTLEKILLTFPELNPTWLLLGREEMLLINKEKNENPKEVEYKSGEDLIHEIFDIQRKIMQDLKKNIF